ncbi:thiamine phosphate synthase [Burkholderia pseudomallei]|uniref:thiamine phosphate synthase n=1 Tax=Burkholderia pseudomallei TaxID=28450 RepID=UPI0007C6B19A|nr:thiamine phosphate synthase [Burkholderia pseudomallei]
MIESIIHHHLKIIVNKSANLPSEYLITPEPPGDEALSDYLATLERTLKAGISLVQLRAKAVTAPYYARLTEYALACCRRYNARLLVNAAPEVALSLHTDGVHLTSTRLMTCSTRPLPAGLLVSAACHDEDQVRHADSIGVDLITISPVMPTATHTTAEPLGWPRFRELATLTSVPVYALGGMSVDSLAEARNAGAYGIAAIRAFWGSNVDRS